MLLCQIDRDSLFEMTRVNKMCKADASEPYLTGYGRQNSYTGARKTKFNRCVKFDLFNYKTFITKAGFMCFY